MSWRNHKLTYALATKNKKKKPGGKAKINGISEKANGTKNEAGDVADESEHDEPETPIDEAYPQDQGGGPSQNGVKSPSINGTFSKTIDIPQPNTPAHEESFPLRSPVNNRSRKDTMIAPSPEETTSTKNSGDTETRLDALLKERVTLREEVAALRRSLEEIQVKHEAEVGHIQEQLEDTQGEKDHAETQYRNILGKVNTIKSQLGERLKADAVCMSFNRGSHLLTRK